MEKHGGKTVFFGRFVAVLRSRRLGGGLGRMDWWKFLFWNAAGGIAGRPRSGSSRTTRATPPPTRSSATGSTPRASSRSGPLTGFVVLHYGKKRLENRL